MMKKEYSAEITQAVRSVLEELELHYDFIEERGVFKFSTHLLGRLRVLEYRICIYKTDLIIYGLIPIDADPNDPEEMRQLQHFLTLVNYQLRSGNFELDCTDGEICYKCYIDCEGLDAPTPEMIKNALSCIPNMFDRFAPGILRILLMHAEAPDAFALCETPSRSLHVVDSSKAAPEQEDLEEPEELEDNSDLWALLEQMRAEDHILDSVLETEE